MNSTITNIFLSTFILISASVMSQDNAIQKQPFGVESAVSGNLLNPPVSDAFRANIFPNPTFIGKVKMNWPDWAEVTEIHMILASTNQIKVIEPNSLLGLKNLKNIKLIFNDLKKIPAFPTNITALSTP